MSFTVWFTGIPLSGKSTLGNVLAKSLFELGYEVELLDSDNIVFLFVPLLKSSPRDRDIISRSMAISANYLNRHNVISICCATTPRKEIREYNREIINKYVEIYCRCKLSEAEKRDYKGVYKLARNNSIKNFTGISEDYIEPENPELIIDTDSNNSEESLNKLLNYLSELKFIDLKGVKNEKKN